MLPVRRSGSSSRRKFDLTNAVVAGPSGSPASISIDLSGGNPNPGDTIGFNLTLPDGSSQTITLTATTASPPAANQFTIGATPAATATNLQTALTTAVSNLDQTALPAASAIAASNSFFEGETQLASSDTVAAALEPQALRLRRNRQRRHRRRSRSPGALGPAAYGDTFVFQLGNNPPSRRRSVPPLILAPTRSTPRLTWSIPQQRR